MTDGTSAIRFYFSDTRRVQAFGGPTHPDDAKSFDAPRPVDSYASWIVPLWGRRCAYYLGALGRGLILAGRIRNDEQFTALGDRLLRQATTLRRQFCARHGQGVTVRRSIEQDHGITNFHRTYLDPVLFSALCLLAEINADDWQTNPELGLETAAARNRLRKQILRIIGHEVAVYTKHGQVKSDLLIDDATLWWGIYEMVRAHGRRFCMPGGHTSTGLVGATEMILRLAEWTRDKPAYPTPEIARTEATAEIHCSWRTQMMIVQNAIAILSLTWSAAHRQRLVPVLSDLIGRKAYDAKQWWDQNQLVRGHAYFVGLGLEVVSQLALAGMFSTDPHVSLPRTGMIGPFSKKQIAKALRCSVPKLNQRADADNPRLIRVSRQEWLIDEATLTGYDRQRIDAWEVARTRDAAGQNPIAR